MTLSNRGAPLSLIVAFAIGGAAHAQGQADSALLFTGWEIQPGAAPSGILDLAGGEFVLKQKLLPLGLAELAEPVNVPELKLALPALTQLVAVGDGKQPLYCDITRYKKKANATGIACFADLDSDGKFEGHFTGLSMTGAILSLDGRLKFKKLKPIAPLSYRPLAPARFNQELFVGIQRRNYFNIYSRESFMLVYGNAAHTEEITQPIQFKSAEMPKDMTVLGASFTAISETAGKMRIEVKQAMPRQPFGVIRTTTYRFY